MPFGVKPVCSQCRSTAADIWRKTLDELICNGCFEKKKEDEKMEIAQKIKQEEQHEKSEPVDKPKPMKIVLRKSTRMTRNYKTRSNPYALPKPALLRARGRRSIMRRTPVRTPPDARTWFRTNRAYLLNGYLRIGDIVSMVGTDGVTYYAQLRGFITDLFGEKKAVITWLLPTKDHKPGGVFKLENFYHGPDEDTPRRLSGMELECRIPFQDSRFNMLPLFRMSETEYIQETINI